MIMSGSLVSKPVLAAHWIVETTGRVELEREGWSRFHPVPNYTTINPGDLVRPASGVKLKLFCDHGKIEPVLGGETKGINQICPPPRIRISRKIVTPRLLNPYIPYIISPRATSVLTDKPMLRWHDATNANSFMVTVRGRGLNWTQEFSRDQVCQKGICQVVYPGSKRLKPGVSYKLIVETDRNRASTEDSTGGLGFKRIKSDQAKEIQRIAGRIKEQNLPKEFKPLALAELYGDYDLTAKAIEILEGLENDQKIVPIYRLLGDLYRRIGLVVEAKAPYSNAVELATATDHWEELAAAKAGLGEVNYARGNRQEGVSLLEEAKEIYQQFGDRERLEKLEKRLEELK
ncbi:MAG: tetratricopeptide repeat protein [Moorea sp. SIO3G5]|nr:tetratricopeptide repeat protein [Moorena sp. SIO3G5]